MKTQDLHGDLFTMTANTLSFFKPTEQEAAPIVDTIGNLYSVYSAAQETGTSSNALAVPEIGASIGYDVATGVAAKAIATTVFEGASDFVAPPVAVGYAMYATGSFLLESHFVKAYVTEVVKSVYSSLEANFAQKQSELETALYEWTNTPFAGGF